MASPTTAGEPASPPPANSAFRVLAAIADLGEATAAAIAAKAGLGYSTVTPKLQAWENAGQAEKYYNQDRGQRLWRLTEAGKATTATPAQQTDTPAGGGTGPAPAAPESAKRKRQQTAAQPAPGHPSTGEEAKAAEPARPDDDAAPPALPPDAAGAVAPAAQTPTTATPTTGQPDAPTSPVSADDGTVPADGDAGQATGEAGTPIKRRRPKGALEASALRILQANPDTEYKVGAMKAAIDAADADTGYPKVSEGAVSNALDKLAHRGAAVRVEDRKAATFQLAPTTD
ncbi:DNA-binding MarR family transcriptional regulator [Actinoplanes octamycinicus]|uniref:DNA-binding MarR family transcriptional regulator n=1 Tax=Actinoplanes octamycinicus TaxID=135948 RepID=A0A7W7GU39_9ACTN|nr:hypothetical protein [Actinoplanes octamycinicus]MBB4738340.1 DNA-binding MarR family transcriptional regulator [Actinoplanes octamycinicus]GIE57457.1 hypothetical protein Aoc01nite_28590 [Actinoplanes octamycinicus]